MSTIAITRDEPPRPEQIGSPAPVPPVRAPSALPSGPYGASTPAGPETLLSLPPLLAGLPVLRELPSFWPAYLWHHRRPWTRRLHHLGSWACIAGAIGAIAWVWALPIGLALGYLFAFSGHWVVERNRPLTFGRPVLAGICNWIMFALELGGRLELHMQTIQEQPRDDWDDADVGNQ